MMFVERWPFLLVLMSMTVWTRGCRARLDRAGPWHAYHMLSHAHQTLMGSVTRRLTGVVSNSSIAFSSAGGNGTKLLVSPLVVVGGGERVVKGWRRPLYLFVH